MLFYYVLGFPCGLSGKKSACNAGDLGSIPGLGRSPGEGKVFSLRYSGLENSMDYTVAKSDMTDSLSLSLFTFITYKRMKSAPHSILICRVTANSTRSA